MRILELRFDRQRPDGTDGFVPVRPFKGLEEPEFDWHRDRPSEIGVLAPRTLSKNTAPTITVRLADAVDPESLRYLRADADADSVLGGSTAAPVVFGKDGAATSTLSIAADRLERFGIEVARVTWHWKWSSDGLEWIPFDRTNHRIVVTLDQPAPPWGRPLDPTRVLPWRSVIAVVCEWAQGEKTVDDVVTSLAARIYALGGQRIGDEPIHYDGTRSRYVSAKVVETPNKTKKVVETFDLDGFIELAQLRGDNRLLCCQDTACGVAILSAVLGCPLRVQKLCPKDAGPGRWLRTQPIRLLGSRSHCPEVFHFHEVATFSGREGEVVWDACLQVDMDAEPDQPPRKFRLPNRTPLDSGGSAIDYRRRFLQSESRKCAVDTVGDNGVRYPGVIPPGAQQTKFFCIDRLRAYYRELIAAAKPAMDPLPPSKSHHLADAMNWPIDGALLPEINHEINWHVGPARLWVLVVPAGSHDAASTALIDLAASSAAPWELCPGVGDVALYGTRFEAILMARRGITVRLVNDPAHLVDLVDVATRIDKIIVAL